MAFEDPGQVVAYNPQWPELFFSLGIGLRAALGDIALRIDHIGSTSVEGLDNAAWPESASAVPAWAQGRMPPARLLS
jgi:hypothetical protein